MRPILVAAVLAFTTFGAPAQGTAFTYQGRLNDGVAPANGSYDLSFALYNDVSAGAQQGAILTNLATAVSNGLFTITMDFGNQFSGANRWLEIGVRTNGGGAFTTLAPRQKLTATPYAVTAGNVSGTVSAGSISGTIPLTQLPASLVTNGASGVTISGTFSGAVTASQFTGTITSNNIASENVTADKLAKTWDAFRLLTLTNPVPGSGTSFGQSFATFGNDRIVVGSYGGANLYRVDGSLILTFTNPEPPTNGYDNFFGYPVAALGNDRVYIGATTAGSNYQGKAYLFNTNGTLLTTFINPSPTNGDEFGYPIVPVGGDRVLIGAIYSRAGTTNISVGIAYLFNINGTLLTTITNPTPARNDFFSEAMAAAGDRLFFGVGLDDTIATNAGTVYVFNTNGVLLNTFTNPVPQAFAGFGYPLLTFGSDRIFIGAANGLYLFHTNGTLLTAFTNLQFNGSFPSVIPLDDNRLLIGASGSNVGATNAGVVYLANTNGALLLTITNPVPVAYDYFGINVASVGGKAVIYAQGPFAGLNYDGVAYLYGFDYYVPGLLAETLRAGAVGTDALADNAVTAAKIGGVLRIDQIPNIDDARLSSNVALRNANQTFTGVNAFGSSFNSFNGNGSGLTSLNAGSLVGSAPWSVLPVGIITNNAINVVLNGTFNTNNGGNLTNLNASNLATGNIADARLSANVALRAGGNVFSGNQIFTNGNIGIGTNNPSALLQVNGVLAAGSLRAPGAGTNTATFAFVHVAVTTNTSSYITTIYNPLTDADPGAILIVTHNWTADTNSVTKYDTNVVGVFYAGGHWAIFHENQTSPILGRAFNVLVIKP